MRFGAAASIAIAMCAIQSTTGPTNVALPRMPDDDTVRVKALPSVARAVSHRRGMNAAQLARLSAKNARRKRRR